AKFLYTSTSEVYGVAVEIPTPEDYRGDVNPVGPRSCYDEAKRCGESYVIAYKQQHGLDIRIARIFNTYGPKMRSEGVYGRVVPRFVEQALGSEAITVFGSGEQTRSFCYVTDQVEGLLKLAFLEEAEGEVVNIGNDEEITIIGLANMIRDLTNSGSEIMFGELPKDDPPRRKPDISKAKRILGWKPRVKLEEGLERTIKWFEGREK
ncbi:MAG: GDP-mannose 4,6-dehydratase, partial [Methanophagales archaeon]|nr:GDP-mannose 4,6-dehydratase [Methanophagales archaeon]